jgi:hypothetical protein
VHSGTPVFLQNLRQERISTRSNEAHGEFNVDFRMIARDDPKSAVNKLQVRRLRCTFSSLTYLKRFLLTY